MKLLQSDISEIYDRLSDVSHLIKNKKVLVSGSHGFLGKYILSILEKFECDIVAMDNFVSSDNEPFTVKKMKFVKHDISKPLPEDFDKDFDFIFACAGVASPAIYKEKPLETIDAAIYGTRTCLELSRFSNAKVLCFSSSEVYSGSKNSPIKEDDNGDVSTMTLRSSYDISKKMAETLVYVFNTKYNTRANIIRPFNFYGPMLRSNDFRVLPNFANKWLSKQPLSIYGNGKQSRTFTYVNDGLVGAFRVLLLGKNNEAYNIGNTFEISVLDLANKIKELIDPNIKIELIDVPSHYKTEPLTRCPDITKAMNDVGFNPEVKLDTGLVRFFNWAKENY